MAVKLNSTGGGSVTLDSPSTASNYTVTLPSAAGTLATTTGTGSVFTNPTINGFTGDTSVVNIGSGQIYKDSSGNVGIGTATPGAKLEVYVGNGTLDATGLILNNAYNNYATAYNGSTSIIAKGYSYQGFAQTTIGQIQFALDNGFDSGWGSSIRFYTSSTRGSVAERMRLDASGNLGLGVTPFSTNGKNIHVKSTSAPARLILECTEASGHNWFQQSANDGSLNWYDATASRQAMTLDASGNLLVGTTNTATGSRIYCLQSNNSPSGYFEVSNTSQTTATLEIVSNRNTTNSSYKAIEYYNSGSGNTRFYVNDAGAVFSTSTSITAISDIGLKENIRPLETGLAEVLALQPRRFDWKNGGGSGVAGFIAQEVIDVLPDLVSDYEYNDTETKKALKMGDMIPTLVKAIQELSAQNNALEARLAQLEAK